MYWFDAWCLCNHRGRISHHFFLIWIKNKSIIIQKKVNSETDVHTGKETTL